MDYKQKYEEALERARKINSGEGVAAPSDYTICETIFPELKESEDERIRKRIIEFLSTPFVKKGMSEGALSTWFAWLEKQVDQKPVDKVEPKFKVGDVVRNISNGDTVTITQINKENQFYNYSGWDGVATVHSDFSISEQDNWELVEQKPTWREEDEKMNENIIETISNHYYIISDYKEMISWLKSLKERMKGE